MITPPRGVALLMLIGLALLRKLEALLPSMPQSSGRVKGARWQLSGHCRGRHCSALTVSNTMAAVDAGSEDVTVPLRFKQEDCARKRTEAFMVTEKMSSSEGNKPPQSSSYLTYPHYIP